MQKVSKFVAATMIVAGFLGAISTASAQQAPVQISAQAAKGHFNCQASALQLNLPLGQVLSPVVANPADNPCASDFQAIVSFADPLGLGISTGTAVARTNGDHLPLFARAKIDRVGLANLLGLVDLHARVIRANARIVAGAGGKCTLHSGSTLEKLSVLGQKFDSLNTPLDFDVKLLGVVVAKLHLNATIGGTHPTIGDPNPKKITQRAVWLHITDPVLQASLADLILGEADVNAIGKPCA